MTTIKSPVKGYTGKTFVGGTELAFKDGKADTVDDLSEGARSYLLQAGYTVGKERVDRPEAEAPVDSRDFDAPIVEGTKLRDAAVDPHEDDFLAPTNAGQADPHGPDVVSPEVHASQGVRPVKGGDVHVDDPDAQDAAETAHTEDAASGDPVVGVEQPSGNASADEWRAYAISQGASEDDVKDLGRNQLRDKYSS